MSSEVENKYQTEGDFDSIRLKVCWNILISSRYFLKASLFITKQQVQNSVKNASGFSQFPEQFLIVLASILVLTLY